MVDFARIQNRIYYGYTKAVKKLGVSHSIYRSADGITPIQDSNLLGTKLISVDDDLRYNKTRKYGDNEWQFLPEDAQGTAAGGFALQNYDYIVGTTVTYFIADILPEDRLSPPMCVQCNAIISIVKPIKSLDLDSNEYQEYKLGEGTPLVTACPVSLLEHGSRGDNRSMNLPTSCKLPFYEIILPDFDDVVIGAGDVITDNFSRIMIISSAEQTKKSLGFRIIAAEVGT